MVSVGVMGPIYLGQSALVNHAGRFAVFPLGSFPN